ncbi:MAG TPA: hypothetical protein VFW07_07570 [Parafilimonas sp.]|nr:hypothetical protein [Parafilimonas sp.]
MEVYLLCSKEFSQEKFNEVLEFLQSYDGPVRFLRAGPSRGFRDENVSLEDVDEERFFKQEVRICYSRSLRKEIPEKRNEISWKSMFELCQQSRVENNLPGKDLVILLTNIANKANWFSALDPDNPCNGFVHTAEWEYYVNCSEVFPVAYLLASLVLQRHMFKDMESLQKAVHKRPLGCINDFCEHKRDIILKLRTADICIDCMHLLQDKLDPLEIQQILNILEGVRIRMLFNQNFRQNLKPSSMRITKHGKIFLPDYGNMEIKLTPLEKTLYIFFLNHPEGMMLHDLADHKEELRNIYSRISTSGLLAEINNRIDSLVDVTSNSVSEKMSKIRSAFVKSVGKDLAKSYYIQGEQNAVKGIPLDRCLVENGFEK